MTGLDPALIRIDRARLHHAHAQDAPRLTRALDPLTPASIGLKPRATLIVRRLALRTPLTRADPAEGFVAGLRDDLRARLVSARRGRAGDDEDLFFEDDADLEAAIIGAWLHAGAQLSSRSWLHLVNADTPLTRWRKHILPDRQLLPSTLARLVEASIAEPWLNRFEAAEIRAAATRLLESYGATPAPLEAASPRPPEPTDPADRLPTERAGPILAELTRTAAEARNIVRPDVRRLVALALTIVRRPALITARSFVESLDRLAKTPTLASHASIGPRTVDFARRDGPPKPVKETMPAQARTRRSETAPPTAFEGPATRSLTPKPNALASETMSPSANEHRAVNTSYGGLFFLLNAFLALKLYGDFTRPGDGLKGLSPFELVHMLGKHWFGADFINDPVAPLLIRLAGLGPGEKPGRLFEPPLWSVPDDWLLPWPDAARRRLGFPLAQKSAPNRSPAAQRRRWVYTLARYLAARLQRALDDPDAVAITCTQPGRITLERDHIEIHFPLADHPIALRFAGLDRDPGWVPAAAHFISFSFT